MTALTVVRIGCIRCFPVGNNLLGHEESGGGEQTLETIKSMEAQVTHVARFPFLQLYQAQ